MGEDVDECCCCEGCCVVLLLRDAVALLPALLPPALLAKGDIPEQRRRDRSPIESCRSLSRSLNAWLNSTVYVIGNQGKGIMLVTHYLEPVYGKKSCET